MDKQTITSIPAYQLPEQTENCYEICIQLVAAKYRAGVVSTHYGFMFLYTAYFNTNHVHFLKPISLPSIKIMMKRGYNLFSLDNI